jgi:lambda repressor-like predicted transcriptional regulator
MKQHDSANGHGNLMSNRLDKLIAERLQEVEALQTTKRLLYGNALERRQARTSNVLARAIGMEEQRVNGNGNGHVGSGHRRGAPGEWKANFIAKRQRTADFLAQFDRVKPIARPAGLHPAALNNYVGKGYLKKKKLADGSIGYVKLKEYQV